MNQTYEQNFEKYREYLEEIITGKVPVRDPSIMIVHVKSAQFEAFSRNQLSMFLEFKQKHSDWNYSVFNIEKVFYEILDNLRYTKKPSFITSCERSELAEDMKNSIKNELIKRLEEKLIELNRDKNAYSGPKVLFIQNINSIYDHIQTKDIIAQVINQKGILIIIQYLQRDKQIKLEKETYKLANYNVNSYHFS